MNWKKWKAGLGVSALTGTLTGIIGLALGITWEQAGLLLLVNTAKDMLLYLKDHPIEKVEDMDPPPVPMPSYYVPDAGGRIGVPQPDSNPGEASSTLAPAPIDETQPNQP